MRAYPKYKESGTAWLGDVPQSWSVKRLKRGFDLQKRRMLPSDGNVTAFRDGQVTLRSNRRTEGFTEADKEIGYQGVETNDLVIHAMDAFAGAIGVSDSRGKSTPVYSVCRARSGYEPRYFALTLRHIALSGYITSLGKGVRERSTDFRWNDAQNVLVPVPPVDEQRAILSYLDANTAKIDALIGKQERLIETLAERRQAVISHAVTKGLDPNAPMKDSTLSWLGTVPEHWHISRLRYVIQSIESGTSVNAMDVEPAEGGIGVLKTSCVYTGEFDIHEAKEVDESEIGRVSCPVKKNRLIVSRMNTPSLVGAAGLTSADAPNTYLPDRLWQVEISNAEPRFVHAWTRTRAYRDQVSVVCVGTSSSMQNLGQGDFRGFTLSLPPLKEQREIVEYINRETLQIDALSAKAREMIDVLKERRQALISAAVTGKIDVRGLS